MLSPRSSLVSFVTAPIHDPYFDLTIEGLKQTLLSVTNMLHLAVAEGGAIDTAALINLYVQLTRSTRAR